MFRAQPLTAEQRIEKAVVAIMGNKRYVALSGVLMIGDRQVAEELPPYNTAQTNGRDEFYCREFVDKLNDAELRFLILHECYHKLYRHTFTWKHLYDEHPVLANVACDYVINAKLVDDNTDGFATMSGELAACGAYDAKYLGWDSAAVFHDLKKQMKQQQQEQQNNQDQGECESCDDGEGQPQGGGQGDGGGGGGKLPQGFDQHDWESAAELPEEDQKKLARDIAEAVRQGAMSAGKTGSEDSLRDLEDLLAPQVDWREVLRDFVTQTCSGKDFSTYRRPNRRFVSHGVYLPSAMSQQVGEIVVAIDTSGSISQRDVTVFVSELASICEAVKPDKLRILYWGTQVVREEIYETQAEIEDAVKTTKPAGGGGTMIECVCEYLRDNRIDPQMSIVLTDGYLGGSWGTWVKPVFWAILDNPSTTAAVGTTLHLKSSDL